MTSYRENLIDRMIRLYGYEDKIVIDFAHLCETWKVNKRNDTTLRMLVESHEADPVV